MYDKNLVIEIFRNIDWSIELISQRSRNIAAYEDFVSSEDGLEKLDSICMQLINIGEALKQIDKITASELLQSFPGVDWKGAKGLRDIITHHYFDIDAEVVFKTIRYKLPNLQEAIRKLASLLA